MDCEKILDTYLTWIKDNTVCESFEDSDICSISTPFLDTHNDHIQIYLEKQNENEYVLTDDGYTINDLSLSGITLSSVKRSEIFNSIINGFGVSHNPVTDEVYIDTNSSDVGKKKHRLLQAIIAVGDMHNLSRENVKSIFKEEVGLFFTSHNIYPSKDVNIIGKTGFDYNIDFMFNPTEDRSEILVKTVTNPKKENIASAIFAFKDINEAEKRNSQNIVIYDDREKAVSSGISEALRQYDIEGIPWGQLETKISEF